MIRARPAISSAVPPFIRRPIANAAICEGVASPSTMSSIAAAASVSRREWPSTTLTTISLIATMLPPSRDRHGQPDRLAGRGLDHVEEVLQQLLAAIGQDRLGVELDAVEGDLAVAQAHDRAV